MTENHPSRPRNKLIAQAFYDIHLIEHYGSGMKRIKQECDQNGNDYPIMQNEMGTFSTIYLPRKTDDTIKSASGTINETVNETIKGQQEEINGSNKPHKHSNEAVNETVNHNVETVNEEINGRHGEIKGQHEPVNEVVNAPNEKINGNHAPIKSADDTIKSADDTIKSADDTIKMLLATINIHEGMKRDDLAAAIHRSIPTVARLLAYLEHEGKIIYRGSKKTGGYYAIKPQDKP